MQYRLENEGSGTRLKFYHRAGWLPKELRDGEGINKGWTTILGRIREAAERKQTKGTTE